LGVVLKIQQVAEADGVERPEQEAAAAGDGQVGGVQGESMRR